MGAATKVFILALPVVVFLGCGHPLRASEPPDTFRVLAIRDKAHPVHYYTPAPRYPLEAARHGWVADGAIDVSFNADGEAIKAVITRSTGSTIMDNPMRQKALEWWRSSAGNPSTIHVPFSYVAVKRIGHVRVYSGTQS